MNHMRRRDFLSCMGAGTALGAATGWTSTRAASAAGLGPSIEAKTFASGRDDGRFVETAGFLHKYLQELKPKLAFRPDLALPQFPAWRRAVREKLLEMMRFPEVPPQPEPQRVDVQAREGYRLERWEAYPEPYSVVPYYVLIPDGASQQSPLPAVICFPGSTKSKESLAGEPELGQQAPPDDPEWSDNRMAYHYVRRGMVAVAMDNPATNELASPLRPRGSLAVCAIWMGRCYEAISVFQKACVLRWLANQHYVNPKRIATSGHSLGAKPADILAVLYPDVVHAVVHNDFVCNWQERAVAQNLDVPGAHQIVPGLFEWFDYTDLEASLAPRPCCLPKAGVPIRSPKSAAPTRSTGQQRPCRCTTTRSIAIRIRDRWTAWRCQSGSPWSSILPTPTSMPPNTVSAPRVPFPGWPKCSVSDCGPGRIDRQGGQWNRVESGRPVNDGGE